MQLNLLPTVQQAITNLLTVYEPEFLRFGYGLFLSFATILTLVVTPSMLMVFTRAHRKTGRRTWWSRLGGLFRRRKPTDAPPAVPDDVGPGAPEVAFPKAAE